MREKEREMWRGREREKVKKQSLAGRYWWGNEVQFSEILDSLE